MKKPRPIKTQAEAQALAVFLEKERLRHQGDIERIEKDLRLLDLKWHIEKVEVDADDWWFV